MSDFIKNTLTMVIVGDEENEQFDGKIKMSGKEQGIIYHCDSIKKIVRDFIKEGYPLNNIDYSNVHESGFSLVNMGHILFCNCTSGSNIFGYLFLPSRLTEKQIESLRIFESNFQKFQQLYLMKIDSSDNEIFEGETSSYDFDVNNLVDTYYRVKTK